MAGTSIARLLGLAVEAFSEFLQRLIEGNRQAELKEKKLIDSLYAQGGLTLEQLLKQPISELKSKLDKVDTGLLDKILVLIFEKANNRTEAPKSENSSDNLTNKHLKIKSAELIEYLDFNRKEYSLERNNIKNSLQHGV